MRPQNVAKLIGIAILIFIVVIIAATSTYVVEPGSRGVEVTLGQVSPVFKPQGFGFKKPFVTTIVPVMIKRKTKIRRLPRPVCGARWACSRPARRPQ